MFEHPLDPVLGAVHAANVWSIWLESPVSNWESDHLDTFISKILDVICGIETLPMSLHNAVSSLWSKSLTESPGIHTNSLFGGLTEELVEERWGNPWLEDHPATDVGADDCLGTHC